MRSESKAGSPIKAVRPEYTLLVGDDFICGSIAHREAEFVDVVVDTLDSPAKVISSKFEFQLVTQLQPVLTADFVLRSHGRLLEQRYGSRSE